MGFPSLREMKKQIAAQEQRGEFVMHNYDFSGDLNQPADWICGAVVICEQDEII